MFGVHAHHAAYIVDQIRNSEPKVYINGKLGQPVEFMQATRMDVNVPGEGVFSVMLIAGIKGFTEAGTIHDNVIEFQAGSKQVRIECNGQVVHSERPVFTRLRP